MKVRPPMMNIKTGEVLNEKSEKQAVAEALRELKLKRKQLEMMEEDMIELLRPHFEEHLVDGEGTFFGFDVARGRRMFNKALFEKNAPEELKTQRAELQESLKSIDEDYMTYTKSYLKLPKFL